MLNGGRIYVNLTSSEFTTVHETLSASKDARAIGCGRTPTGERGFGATLRHDISSGKAADAEEVRRSALSWPA